MQSFMDRTYCPMYLLCQNGVGCARALTGEVREAAHALGLPICQYGSQPECYKAIWEPMPLGGTEDACAECHTVGSHKLSCESKGE
jgi:hypothetical protein